MNDKGGGYKVAAGIWQPCVLKGGVHVLDAQLCSLPLCPAVCCNQM